MGQALASESTIRRVFQDLDPTDLDTHVRSWFCTRTGIIAGRRVIAVDGKTMRGARTGKDPAPHLLAALDQATGGGCGTPSKRSRHPSGWTSPGRLRFSRSGAPEPSRIAGVSSLGFCGGWFVWCRWLPVVIVRGGGCRVPRRLRARWGFACRWRSVAGWCPYQWTHSAVASTGGVDVLPRALVTDQLGLVQGA